MCCQTDEIQYFIQERGNGGVGWSDAVFCNSIKRFGFGIHSHCLRSFVQKMDKTILSEEEVLFSARKKAREMEHGAFLPIS